MKQIYEAARDYKGRWGVFDTTVQVWYYPPPGTRQGRKWAEEKAKELNEFMAAEDMKELIDLVRGETQ